MSDPLPAVVRVWATIPHKCPVCDGTGLVSRPPWIAGDVYEWSTTGTGPYTCKVCHGTAIVWAHAPAEPAPPLNSPDVAP